MARISVLDFLFQKKIVGITVMLTALTFSFISKITEYIYDPIFNYLFPKRKLKDIYVKLPNGSKIQVGLFFLEIVRWLVYTVLTYLVLNFSIKL